MTQPTMQTQIGECLQGTLVGFLLPLFLAAAKGNTEVARATIMQLIGAYKATTDAELDLAARIVGYSIVSLDNLRLSMTPGLPDAKVLQYRSSAVTLGRASLNARKLLTSAQATPATRPEPSRPTTAPAPTAAAATPTPVRVTPSPAPLAIKAPASYSGVSDFPADLATMKQNALIMMNALSKTGAALPSMSDPNAFIRAAAAEAVAKARRASTT